MKYTIVRVVETAIISAAVVTLMNAYQNKKS